MTVASVIADLVAEQQALNDVVAGLADEAWFRPTPSPRWRVFEQIAHLTYFDDMADIAITDPEQFGDRNAEAFEMMASGEFDLDTLTLAWSEGHTPTELLERWRANRAALAAAATTLGEKDRVAWYGPSMGAKSFLTARLMEVWAHGQDVVDAVGGHREPTDRLRHIAQLGVITHKWSYIVRDLDAPQDNVRVSLTAPSGEIWTWHEDAIDSSITGSAEDFCLVVTQRRHVEDTDLVTEGAAARDWMAKAQAFAGSATVGPAPR